MKKVYIFLSIILFLFITGCSSLELETPDANLKTEDSNKIVVYESWWSKLVVIRSDDPDVLKEFVEAIKDIFSRD